MQENTSYGDFAYFYDLLTDDVEYGKRCEYVERIIDLHLKHKPELICDLGCGTGTVCNMLTKKGYDCIGIDSSEDMLSVAMQKNADAKILYLNQNICDFELYGTVDVFLCMLDTVNYIDSPEAIKKMFSLVHNYLNPGGILIFDVNTLFKFQNILASNTYAYEKDNVFYTWENYYENGVLEFFLNFFVTEDEGDTYTRFSEQHFQYYYSREQLKTLGTQAGLSLEGIYSDLSLEPPKDDDERVFFVFRKEI